MTARPEPLADLLVSPLGATPSNAPGGIRTRVVAARRAVRSRALAFVGLSAVFATPVAVVAATGDEGAAPVATALVLGAFLSATAVYFGTGLALLRGRHRVAVGDSAGGDGVASARSGDARAS